MDEREIEQRKGTAEWRREDAIEHAEHALMWLRLDKPVDKPVGTSPWSYDLREAQALLEKAAGSVRAALAGVEEIEESRL